MNRIDYIEEQIKDAKKVMEESLDIIQRNQAIMENKQTEILRLQDDLIDELLAELNT